MTLELFLSISLKSNCFLDFVRIVVSFSIARITGDLFCDIHFNLRFCWVIFALFLFKSLFECRVRCLNALQLALESRNSRLTSLAIGGMQVG